MRWHVGSNIAPSLLNVESHLVLLHRAMNVPKDIAAAFRLTKRVEFICRGSMLHLLSTSVRGDVESTRSVRDRKFSLFQLFFAYGTTRLSTQHLLQYRNLPPSQCNWLHCNPPVFSLLKPLDCLSFLLSFLTPSLSFRGLVESNVSKARQP
jgi:hypothetical protein